MSEGGGPPEEKPLPVSMWTDEKLRPWTIDEKLDEDINDANERLNIMVNKTSGSKLAGKCMLYIPVMCLLGDAPACPLWFVMLLT
jgi:hypothetical protein